MTRHASGRISPSTTTSGSTRPPAGRPVWRKASSRRSTSREKSAGSEATGPWPGLRATSSRIGSARRTSSRFQNDEYWTAPGFVEDLYASQTIGGQLWDDHPVSFFSDASSGTVGLPGNPTQAMLLRGAHNVNGGGWAAGSASSTQLALESDESEEHEKLLRQQPAITGILNAYETKTGKTFRGFGQGMWPTQMIVDGHSRTCWRTRTSSARTRASSITSKTSISVHPGLFRRTPRHQRGLQPAVLPHGLHQPHGRTLGMNMLSVDVNQTLRGSTTPNPNFGRPSPSGKAAAACSRRTAKTGASRPSAW